MTKARAIELVKHAGNATYEYYATNDNIWDNVGGILHTKIIDGVKEKIEKIVVPAFEMSITKDPKTFEEWSNIASRVNDALKKENKQVREIFLKTLSVLQPMIIKEEE